GPAAGLPSGLLRPSHFRSYCHMSSSGWRRCRRGSLWHCWDMRSGPMGERKCRKPYLAGRVPTSAQPQPRNFAGTCIEWTSGRAAAHLILVVDGYRVIPCKEPKMKATVNDEGLTQDTLDVAL